MPRAFVLEPSKYDSSQAEDFGKRVYVFAEGEFRISIFDDRFVGKVVDKLMDYNFDPDQDFIVLTGDLIVVSLFAVAATSWTDLRVKALAWHSGDRCYKELLL